MKRLSRSRALVLAMMFLLMISAGVNALQARRILALTDPGGALTTVIGRRVSDMEGFSMDGSPRRVLLRGDLPTVVYFFSPTCAWCERNWANIEALRVAADGRYRVVGVTSGRGSQAYMSARSLGVDVLEGLSDNARQSFGFSGTPHTLVVSSEGLVTHDWRGAFTARIERQVEELFGVLLPGLLPKVSDNQPQ